MARPFSELRRRLESTPEGRAALKRESKRLADPCPLCGSNLQGDPIPEESRHMYGDKTHFSRRIGIYSREQDRTVAWACPDCKGEWPRG